MKLLDYKIRKNWKPEKKEEIIWYLERKINYDDWRGLKPELVLKYLNELKIDPGKKLMLVAYFRRYMKKIMGRGLELTPLQKKAGGAFN